MPPSAGNTSPVDRQSKDGTLNSSQSLQKKVLRARADSIKWQKYKHTQVGGTFELNLSNDELRRA